MKTHRKLFFIYCQVMLIIILSKQLIDVYFRNEVTEFLVFRIVATLVYLIVGALVLTSMEIRTKKVK